MNSWKDPIRVLIVDDCPVVRKIMIELLAAESNIQIVGEAVNGQEGVQLSSRLRPDLIIMDIEMPIMNGLEAIEIIMKETPTPILVVTSYSSAHLAYEAVSRGALEVIEKPSINSGQSVEFIHKIKLLAGVKVIRHISGKNKPLGDNPNTDKSTTRHAGVVAIASSLGGAKVLETILSQLTADFPLPIVIAQHISEGFSEALADWLNHKTTLTVKVASQGEVLLPGKVLIAPSEYNMRVNLNGKVELLPYLPGQIYHPSCDILLSSVAHVYNGGSIGIILTGMGEDGVKGIQAIKAAGGVTIAQNKETSLIYNMSRLVIEGDLADFIMAGNEISTTLLKLASL